MWGVAKRNRRLETGSGTHPSQDWTVSSPHLDEDQASESSSGSPGSCRSSSPEPSDQRNSSAERGSSPECEGRNSPQLPTSP